MSSWMWDVLGSLAALFLLVVIVVDVLVAVVLVTVLGHWWHDRSTRPDVRVSDYPPVDDDLVRR